MSPGVFNAYSRYYDLLYRDKDYDAEAEYVSTLLRKHGVVGRDILEFGSGTGKHGRILAAHGFRVLGIEQSAEMVSQTCQSVDFSCVQGDIRRIDFSRHFDAIVSLFHVMSYQTQNADIEAVFSKAAQHLCPGGVFVFDIWYSPAVMVQRPSIRIKRMSDDAVDVTRIAEPIIFFNENRVDVHYTIIVRDKVSGSTEQFSEIHPMRYFSMPEIDMLAAWSGFERVAAEEFLTGKTPGDDTWGVCLILRRT
jgi:SAM-dependent methyltransferase